MSNVIVGILGLVLFLVLIGLGMRIAFAAALAGFLGLWFVMGLSGAGNVMGTLPYATMASYSFTILPLFMIMGNFAFHSGVTEDLFVFGRKTVGRLPGGLVMATILAGTGFAACCGASVASSAILGKVCMPEMDRYKCDRRLAAGCIATTGTLASMIPPSGLIVTYGIITEQSIGKLLIAGFFPGILIASIYMAYVFVRAVLNPDIAPRVRGITWRESLASAKGVWGALLLAGIFTGGIYGGVFTPTEAGAAGAMAAFLLAIGQRRLGWKKLKASLLDTGRTTCMIFLIIVGIFIFGRFLTVTRVPYMLSDFVVGLPVDRMVVLIAVLLVYVLLGMFMDAIGMVVITVPIFVPAMMALGFNPIWFAIVVVLMAEICLITPPVGLNVYVLKGVIPDMPMESIFRGIIPFFFLDLVALAFIIAFPQIALFLPSHMTG